MPWQSKKQNNVSLSSIEAEYHAIEKTTKEIVWLVSLLKDMFTEVTRPINLFCDNKAMIHIASNVVFHEHTKHLEVNCHYIRIKYQAKLLNLIHMS